MSLAGKKVVVVGGSSGIGLATAELAKREGADVVIASRNAERLKAAANKIGATASRRCHQRRKRRGSFPQMRGRRSCRRDGRAIAHGAFQNRCHGRCSRDHGKQILGRLACCAVGRNPSRRLADACDRLPQHPSRPGAAIVGAVNGALESLTKGLALELAPVRVNAVSPGTIDTPIRASMPEAARRDMLAKTAATLPVGRVGASEDIAQQILTFMMVGFATGSVVYIDGGALVV